MHIAQNWRLNAFRYALKAPRCPHCGQGIIGMRSKCPNPACGKDISAEIQKECSPELFRGGRL